MGNKNKRPTLFATLGFPGSGKTYFAKRLAKDFNLFHLNSDRLRLAIFPRQKHTREEDRIVFRVMDDIAEQLLAQGISVIYDANSTKKIYRKRLQIIARRNGARYYLLWFQTPVAVALQRIKKRRSLKSAHLRKYHRPIHEAVLSGIRKGEERPIREPHIKIDGRKPYKWQKKTVSNFLHIQ